MTIRAGAVLLTVGLLSACMSPSGHRAAADRTAYDIIEDKQADALDRTEPFHIETPEQTLRRQLLGEQGLAYSGPASLGVDAVEPPDHWSDDLLDRAPEAPPEPEVPWDHDVLDLTLVDALAVAARNSREYQTRKEDLFRSALSLELERNAFRLTYSGLINALISTDLSGDRPRTGTDVTAQAGLNRRFQSGATLATRLAFDFAQLLSMDRASAYGVFADMTVTIPLLRGSGRHIVTESLTQAERDVIYAIWTFERFKRTFAVRVASDYLAVLQQLDQVENAEENYRRLVMQLRRARRMADAGRLSEIQVDQARQDELRARDRWVAAREAYERRQDTFKIALGLPTDARIRLDRGELERLAAAGREALGGATTPETHVPEDAEEAEAMPIDAPIVLHPPTREDGGPFELPEARALELAFGNRLDLSTAHSRVQDAQRQVIVAADALGADLRLVGRGQAGGRRGVGSAGGGDVNLRPDQGFYSAALELDLPWERTSERVAYRNALIALERSIRSVQELEDQVKLDIRDALRNLLQARESYRIQAQAVALAERRVESTQLFLEAGRVQIRDVLEAQEALISAQNALTGALVNYRVAELELQRDAGVLQVDETGLWREYNNEQHDE